MPEWFFGAVLTTLMYASYQQGRPDSTHRSGLDTIGSQPYIKPTGMYPIWYVNTGIGVLLQLTLFWRALRVGLWRHYPWFYAYLVYTSLWSLVCSVPFVLDHPAYRAIYWSSYLFAGVLRFGISAELHRHIFPRGSSLRKRANIIVLFSLTLLALFFWSNDLNPQASLMLDSARKLALSVVVWSIVLLGLAYYYRVQIGRNVWGIAVGLLTFLGTEFVDLAAMDLVPRLRIVFGYVHPVAFVTMLVIWTYTLWDYCPNPRPALDESVARQFLADWQHRWTQVPNVLRKVVKP